MQNSVVAAAEYRAGQREPLLQSLQCFLTPACLQGYLGSVLNPGRPQMIATRTTALLSACGPPAALAALTSAEGDLEEIDQDVEEAISIAVANGEFDNFRRPQPAQCFSNFSTRITFL